MTHALVPVLLVLFALGGQSSDDEAFENGQKKLSAGAFVEAAALFEEVVDADPENAQAWYLLGYARHAAKDLEGALEAHVRAAEFDQTAAGASYNAACACAVLGDPDGAFEWLGRALEAGFKNLQLLMTDADLASIRNDARFNALLPTGTPATFVEDVTVHYVLDGENPGDRYGWIGRNAGDCDADGVADLLVSAPFLQKGGAPAGRIYVHSGKDGKELWRADGQPGDLLGIGIEGVGDVNGDGRSDQLAGASGAGQGAGAAFLYSGADGTILHTWRGAASGDAFGRKVAGACDQDGDGVPDVIVGAAGHDGVGTDAGRAYVFSGRTGEELFVLEGLDAGERFGSCVDGYAGDDQRLLIIGAMDHGADKRGCVYVFRGGDEGPELFFKIEGEEGDRNLGRMFVSAVGDVDGDGFMDVYGSDWESSAGGVPGAGRIYVHSGKDGRRLYTLSGEKQGDGFGIGTSEAGDVDGDGCDDLIVGAWQNDDGAQGGGKCYLFSGKSGELVRTYTCSTWGDTFGFDTTNLGDVNGDGVIDFLITSADSFVQGPQSGRVLVISSR